MSLDTKVVWLDLGWEVPQCSSSLVVNGLIIREYFDTKLL
jgi:hypothetical protein